MSGTHVYNISLTAAEWTSADPVLGLGEIGFESDTYQIKVGDGVTAWISLAYFAGVSSYTDEEAQDAVGGMVNSTLSYNDATPSLGVNPGNIKLDDLGTPDDNTDLNANTTNHGLLLKAVAPAANVLNVVGIANGETSFANKALFDATAPEPLGVSAAAGTSLIASHRDHVHVRQSALGIGAIPFDGWVGASWASMTRTGNHSFTTTDNVTGLVEAGTKLFIIDSTVKYFVIATATWNGSITTITLMVTTDFTLAGNPSTLSYSNVEKPYAWPDVFNYTPTFGGTGSMTYTGVTVSRAQWKRTAKTLKILLDVVGTIGGTISYAVTVTSPVNGAGSGIALVACYLNIGGAQVGWMRQHSGNPSVIEVLLQSEGNWSAGASRYIRGSIEFPVA